MDTPFYTELVSKLTNPMKQKPYKESSVKPVYAYLKNLNGGIPPTSLDFLLDRPIVIRILGEKYGVSTQRSIVFAIRNIAKDFERQDILDVWKENIEETEAGKGLPEKGEKSEAQEKAYAQLETDNGGDAWDVIMKKVAVINRDADTKSNSGYANWNGPRPYPPTFTSESGIVYTHLEDEFYNQTTRRGGKETTTRIKIEDRYRDLVRGYRDLEYIVPNLYTQFPPRRNLDYTEMKITTNYKSTLSKEFNYLVIGLEKDIAMRYVFNRYKTDGVYSQQIFDVPENLVKILKGWIQATNKKDGDYLLTKVGRYTHEKTKGDPLKSDDITDTLHKVFGSGISTQMLRHMYLDKYNSPERQKIIHEMMGDAEQMAHSMTTQQNIYVKKKTIRVKVEKD